MPNTRILKMRRPAAVPTLRLPCLRETATAILRALSVGTAATQDIARIIVLDPVLVFELLLTEPLAGNEPASIVDAIARRVERIDSGLLQAWALRHISQQPARGPGAGRARPGRAPGAAEGGRSRAPGLPGVALAPAQARRHGRAGRFLRPALTDRERPQACRLNPPLGLKTPQPITCSLPSGRMYEVFSSTAPVTGLTTS